MENSTSATPPMPTTKPCNVLVLCHGNVCRSPLAAAVLAKVLGSDRVRSRALKVYPPDKRTPPAALKVREYAVKHGYDLSAHRASTVTAEDLRWADLVLYMDQANLKRLKGIGGVYGWPKKQRCLAVYTGERCVPDPNFLPRGSPELEKVLELVARASRELLKSTDLVEQEGQKTTPAGAGV